jgi:hypothetical protein
MSPIDQLRILVATCTDQQLAIAFGEAPAAASAFMAALAKAAEAPKEPLEAMDAQQLEAVEPVIAPRSMKEALDQDLERVSSSSDLPLPWLIELQSTDKSTRIAVRPDDNIHAAVAEGLQCQPEQLEFVLLWGDYHLDDDTLSFLDAGIDDGARLSVRLISLVTLTRDDALTD